MDFVSGKKIYLLSDFHLGVPDAASSRERERKIVSFLEEIRGDASGILLLGDAFDFWFEYRTVVPKGYVRLLGQLAALTDAGIPVHFFVGNHDMWMNSYFQKELNIPVYHEPRSYDFNGKRFLIGHGDGLGPGDQGYKFLKAIFRNPLCQGLFGLLPPVVGMALARYFSQSSRTVTGTADGLFLGEHREWLIQYCREQLLQQHYDFLVFGHRHLPIDFRLSSTSRYINLGDWIRYYTYAVFDGEQFTLKSRYPELESKIYRN